MADNQDSNTALANFIYEVGMLKKTPRTGWPFLGSLSENVAEHSFRTSVIGYVLAKKAGASVEKVVCMCLFHDLHEARTGDFNYVYHRYNKTDAKRALEDSVAHLACKDDILALFSEFSSESLQSKESLLANDADQLDLIANLCVALAQGNTFAKEWLDSALARLKTEEGKALAKSLLATDPNAWWYTMVPKEWWINHK